MGVDVVSVLLGLLIGLALGLLGGGGSILTVPALVYVVGIPAAAATGTSLAIVGTTALVGAVRHMQAGRVNLQTALGFGMASMAGSVVGSMLGRDVAPELLLALFALLMVGAAAAMLWPPRAAPSPASPGLPALIRAAPAGLAVGVMTGFFGVGGGFLIVPALVLVVGLPMRQAVGTSLIVIALASAAGLVTHLGAGAIDLRVTGLFLAGGVLGMLTGARFAGRLPELTLRRAFALLVLALAGYLLVRNVSALLVAIPIGW